jgi:hypothetical protein
MTGRVRRPIAALAFSLVATAAIAVPMTESPRPPERPVADAAAPLRPLPRPGTTLAPEVTRAAGAAIALVLPDPPTRVTPASRPAPRPAPRLAPRLAPAAVTALAQSLRPEARPNPKAKAAPAVAVAGGPEVIVQAAFRAPQATGSVTGRKGTVCGDPAILGKPIPPILGKLKGCGLREGVSVISVAGVALTQPASLDCATARALKDWVAAGVKPAVGRKGGGVLALQVAASYSCRTRNNQTGARISEHGRGRAVDISAVLLADGTAVTVQKDWGSKGYGKTLAAMRGAACGPFNTVLGPGADRFHSDHFHLDTARGRGPYCR